MFPRTKRLFLRPAFAEDWEAILRGVGEEAIVRNLARAPWPYGEAEAREFAALAQDPRRPHFLIVLPNEPGSPVVGSAGMGERDGEAEIGYWIARKYWRRGIASEAAHAVVEIAQMLGYRRLVAGHFADNEASGLVLRKAGFKPLATVEQRWCEARGAKVPCVEYALEFAEDKGG